MSGQTRDLRWMWLASAFAVTAAGQLVAQLALGRLLGAAEFGEVATLYHLMNFVGVPLVALQLTVTSLVARGGSAAPTLRRAAVWGGGAGAGALGLAPAWTGAVALSSVDASRVAACFIPAAFVVAVTRGNVVGRARTRELAAAMGLSAVVRVVATVLGAHLFGVVGATAAAVVSEALLAAALLVLVRTRGKDLGAVVGSTTAGVTATQVAMWVVVNVDLLWARRLLEPADAGRYLLVGSMATGLVSFGQAFLWHRASSATAREAGPAIVLRSAGIVAAASVVAVPVAIVALPRLLGPSFDGLTQLLMVGAVWAVLASVVHTSTATQVIASDRGVWRLLPVALLSVATPAATVELFGADAVVLAFAAVANTTLGVLALVGPELPRRRRTGITGAAHPIVADPDDRDPADAGRGDRDSAPSPAHAAPSGSGLGAA